MTVSEVRHILGKYLPFPETDKDAGIVEIYSNESRSVSLGVSFETDEETGSDVYIFNLFYDGIYINISGIWTIDDVRDDEFLSQHIAAAWNEFDQRGR